MNWVAATDILPDPNLNSKCINVHCKFVQLGIDLQTGMEPEFTWGVEALCTDHMLTAATCLLFVCLVRDLLRQWQVLFIQRLVDLHTVHGSVSDAQQCLEQGLQEAAAGGNLSTQACHPPLHASQAKAKYDIIFIIFVMNLHQLYKGTLGFVRLTVGAATMHLSHVFKSTTSDAQPPCRSIASTSYISVPTAFACTTPKCEVLAKLDRSSRSDCFHCTQAQGFYQTRLPCL